MVGQVIAGGVASVLTLIALATLFASIQSAIRRDWRFAGGALLLALLFGVFASDFWNSAVTGERVARDDSAPRLR